MNEDRPVLSATTL